MHYCYKDFRSSNTWFFCPRKIRLGIFCVLQMNLSDVNAYHSLPLILTLCYFLQAAAQLKLCCSFDIREQFFHFYFGFGSSSSNSSNRRCNKVMRIRVWRKFGSSTLIREKNSGKRTCFPIHDVVFVHWKSPFGQNWFSIENSFIFEEFLLIPILITKDVQFLKENFSFLYAFLG